MNQAELTRAMNQSRRDYDASKLVNVEILLIAVLVGVALHSWLAFFVLLFSLLAALRVPYLGGAVAFALSILWGVAGWNVATMFHTGVVAHVALAVLGFLIAFGAHKGHRSFWS